DIYPLWPRVMTSCDWYHSGPIPAPFQIREYNEAKPGLGDLIVGWADSQHTHRLALEKNAEARIDRSQKYTFFLGILGILVAGAVGIYGSSTVAIAIACVSIGGPNAATIIGRLLARIPDRTGSAADTITPRTKQQSKRKRG
ncbi:MAG: hypothetical protein WCF85_20235, partial [Rhodospirillaceae bacterium]